MKEKMKEKCFVSCLFLFCFFLFFPITHSASDAIPQDKRIKIELWAELDCYPEMKETEDRMKNQFLDLAHFILEGMIYGFDFCYTPYDKIRGIKNDFSLTPVIPYSQQAYRKIKWTAPHFKDNLICYWLEYERTAEQASYFQNRTSLDSKKVKGKGSGKISQGFEGMKEGFKNSAENAVREYARRLMKNKPEEVAGRLLLQGNPRIYALNGEYVCVLDFFVEFDTIVEYNIF